MSLGNSVAGEDRRGYGRMGQARKEERENVDGPDKDIKNMGATQGPREQYLFPGSRAVSSH